ncbi:6,7-dimethyl-8-ribityllumazine synthase [Leptospira wolffii]|uniref:6,7-dimethyl-8-ribityllumazine synthase n=1 Tax=Leptospira wolffii TaxID=409998 RepID=A0A2M9ZAI2_9LEPT|nr:6,7-dimethyl-8-ribityllumazine synthase [Leptospira wolffii]EPG67496.1 6,7-dimethyl-8-ribityllumazine synthase [Leptospira wolffii serovar Khorat str. Khorat-H2]PJZ65413.1 6,7-dimethyl-8-ribityllumazine synthase [Leptospira wolffii]TGK64709.1 6,7-dimethyl-8-ribityllumazine synthase [Leptospira wolffii]TGK76892.1 6,7-dimethyl-8-ribityllumazine synthase [Leptospira wolffii]TGK77256.1 6,7-dimethyl-8-ribityllumazine synthase [Leptospira wolffii]
MPQELKAKLDGKGQKHCIVVSRFNEFIVESLLKGSLEGLRMTGVEDKDVTVVRIPGAYELPIVVSKAAASKKFDSIICLGAVIRGATAHFDFVAGESAKVGSIGVQHSVPVIFGVLTTDTIEQAIERAGTKAGNKGYEAALTAVEMVNLLALL